MPRNIYILSHSSLDSVYVMKLYEKYKDECNVQILIGSTLENLEFFESIGIPGTAIKYIRFESRLNKSKPKNIWEFVKYLYREKRSLDGLAKEITRDKNSMLFFSSYICDPQFGYLVYVVSKTNMVNLVDVLQIKPKKAAPSCFFSSRGLKNLISLFVYKAVFGNIYFLGGNKSCLFMALNLSKFNVEEISRGSVDKISDVSKYMTKIPFSLRNAVFLYSESRSKELHSKHISINKKMLEHLLKNDFNVYVKLHPQSQKPFFLDEYNVKYIEKYVPFEFVDLKNVFVVIGLEGASLLSACNTLTVSFIKMVYDKTSDFYAAGIEQLSQKKDIRFITSFDELNMILQNLKEKESVF